MNAAFETRTDSVPHPNPAQDGTGLYDRAVVRAQVTGEWQLGTGSVSTALGSDDPRVPVSCTTAGEPAEFPAYIYFQADQIKIPGSELGGIALDRSPHPLHHIATNADVSRACSLQIFGVGCAQPHMFLSYLATGKAGSKRGPFRAQAPKLRQPLQRRR